MEHKSYPDAATRLQLLRAGRVWPLRSILAVIPHLATKADVSALETSIIKWIIATVLGTAGLVFAIAKFVHW